MAPQLGDVQREKLLMNALQRSLKDVFFPCRLAGMQAILGYQDFTEDDLATRVLPMVVPHLLDSSTEVRDKSFAVVTKCLGILKQKHEAMSLQQVPQQQNVVGTTATTYVNSMPATTAAAASAAVSGPTTTTTVPPGVPSSGSGYLSGLSSWMSSSTKPEIVAASSGGITPSSTPVAGTTGSMAATSFATRTAPIPSTPQTTTPSAFAVTATTTTVTKSLAATQLDDSWGEEDDGWGDEDDDNVLDAKPTSVKPFSAPTVQLQLPTNDEEDFFKSFDMKAKMPVRPSGKLVVPKSKATPAPAVTKLKVDKSDWDDF